MRFAEYLRRAGAIAQAKLAQAEAERKATRALRRLDTAGDQIVALRPLVEQAAGDVNDPDLAAALGGAVTDIDHTLTGIGRENDIP